MKGVQTDTGRDIFIKQHCHTFPLKSRRQEKTESGYKIMERKSTTNMGEGSFLSTIKICFYFYEPGGVMMRTMSKAKYGE